MEVACRARELDGIQAGVEKIVLEYGTVTRALDAERNRIKQEIAASSAPSPAIPLVPSLRSARALS